jgi:HlyD family secretion protein
MQNKKRLMILAGAVAVVVLSLFLYARSKSNREAKVIRVSGNIEVTEAELSFKIPGRVEERAVTEGETVKAGQKVARLDSVELAQEVALRRAEVRAAEAALAELEAGSRPEEIAQAEAAAQNAQAHLDEMLAGSRSQEIAAAEAALERAKAETKRAQADYERYAGLFKKEIVSAQQFDAARTTAETAVAREREAEEHLKLVKEGPRKEQIAQVRAGLAEAKMRYALVKEGPRRETIDQARAHLQQAGEMLALAETRLGYAILVSPLTGVVLSKNVEPGEYVAAGTPVVTVGNLQDIWVRAYIEETDLGKVMLGQRVRVKTDSYPEKSYEGRVSFISSEAEFTPKNVQTQKERVKLVYRIKVTISNPNLELKPAMPADAEILLSGNS